MVISGPTTLKPSQTGDYIVTVTYSSITKAGINIASSNGSLAANDSKLKLSSSELVHSSTKSGSGSITWTFKYTAPATTGTQTLYATGSVSKSLINSAPNFTVNVANTTGISEFASLLQEFKLAQNYPNPFNPSTRISWSQKTAGNVSLKLYDVTGKEVAILINGDQAAGDHSIEFDAGNLMSGVYFYTIRSGSFYATRKMLLVK